MLLWRCCGSFQRERFPLLMESQMYCASRMSSQNEWIFGSAFVNRISIIDLTVTRLRIQSSFIYNTISVPLKSCRLKTKPSCSCQLANGISQMGSKTICKPDTQGRAHCPKDFICQFRLQTVWGEWLMRWKKVQNYNIYYCRYLLWPIHHHPRP